MDIFKVCSSINNTPTVFDKSINGLIWYLQVFDGNYMDQLLLNKPFLKAKYCGTVFDNINTVNNVAYIRFFAEKQAVQKSSFSAQFTAMRSKEDDKESCREVRLPIFYCLNHIDKCLLI